MNIKHSRLEYDLHDTWSLKYNFLFRVCYIVQGMLHCTCGVCEREGGREGGKEGGRERGSLVVCVILPSQLGC